MRILTLNHEYPPVGGGGATAGEILAEALVRAGHEVSVLTSRAGDLAAQEVRRGVTIRRVPCVRRHRHYSTAAELATWVGPALRSASKLLKRERFDLIHGHFVLPGGLVAWQLQRRYGLPVVLTAHGSDVPGYNPDRFEVLHKLLAPLWRRIVANCTALTVPSGHLSRLLPAAVARHVAVIPNPFDAPRLAASPPRRRILVATRMVERKGVQNLIAALAGSNSTFEVVIAGDGPYLNTLKKLAAEAGIPATFPGFVSREHLRQLYASASIFVFPSHQENFPMVLLEAMAAGCAVVTTSAPGCVEVVGDAAVLVEPGDSAGLLQALERLAHDHAAVEELRRASRKRVELFASWKIAEMYEDLFSRCMRADLHDRRHPGEHGRSLARS